MIKSVSFKNYKSFKDLQDLEIKPVTILIGKNSSGKSSIAKLLLLIEDSLKTASEIPVKWTGYKDGIELGAEFADLIYGRSRTGKLELKISDIKDSLEVVVGTEKEIPKIFSWTFKGENLLGFDNKFHGFKLITKDKNLDVSSLEFNIDYIGPFRITPLRELSEVNFTAEVDSIGYRGENAYAALLQDSLTTLQELTSRVSDWYQNNFEGWGIQINKEKAPFYQVEVFREKADISINIKDVGQGISQALPLVVKAKMKSKTEELIVIEQPELHLHPAAHGNLGELFVESINDKNKFYLIETHSQNFVLRLRRLIAEKKYSWFTKDSLALYYIDFNEESETSFLKKINVDEKGKVDYWPDNIFNETLVETIALRDAQK